MTNQEAIKILYNLKPGDYSNPYEKGEAIVMAIKALQAQEAKHSNESSLTQKALDIISRQDAINTITAYPHGDVCVENMENMVHEIKNLSPTPPKPLVKDTISRQAAIDAINALHEEPNAWLDYAVDAVMTLPSAQPNGWLEQNKDKILQAGMKGREIDFRIGGRLFAIREKAQ